MYFSALEITGLFGAADALDAFEAAAYATRAKTQAEHG